MLFEMIVLDLQIGVEGIECFDAFSESYHDVEDQVPVLMTEIDSHFLFLFILGFCSLVYVFIEKVQFNLHLFEFGRTELFLFLFIVSVIMAQFHDFVAVVKEGFKLIGDFEIEIDFGLGFDFLFSQMDFIDGSIS